MNQVDFKKIALAASIMLAMVFTFGCSDDKDDGGKKEQWCVGSIMEGYKACYKIGIKSKALNIDITEAYCNAYKPMMAITDKAPDKAECGSVYEDENECILFGNNEETARPCSE
jgi:hypothetical protein